MPLGMEVDLSPGDFVFDGDPAIPLFGPCLLCHCRPSHLLLSFWYVSYKIVMHLRHEGRVIAGNYHAMHDTCTEDR